MSFLNWVAYSTIAKLVIVGAAILPIVLVRMLLNRRKNSSNRERDAFAESENTSDPSLK